MRKMLGFALGLLCAHILPQGVSAHSVEPCQSALLAVTDKNNESLSEDLVQIQQILLNQRDILSDILVLSVEEKRTGHLSEAALLKKRVDLFGALYLMGQFISDLEVFYEIVEDQKLQEELSKYLKFAMIGKEVETLLGTRVTREDFYNEILIYLNQVNAFLDIKSNAMVDLTGFTGPIEKYNSDLINTLKKIDESQSVEAVQGVISEVWFLHSEVEHYNRLLHNQVFDDPEWTPDHLRKVGFLLTSFQNKLQQINMLLLVLQGEPEKTAQKALWQTVLAFASLSPLEVHSSWKMSEIALEEFRRKNSKNSLTQGQEEDFQRILITNIYSTDNLKNIIGILADMRKIESQESEAFAFIKTYVEDRGMLLVTQKNRHQLFRQGTWIKLKNEIFRIEEISTIKEKGESESSVFGGKKIILRNPKKMDLYEVDDFAVMFLKGEIKPLSSEEAIFSEKTSAKTRIAN